MVIYKITNKINGKIYIGQTIRSNPNYRWHDHLRESDRLDYPLYRAIRKYKKNNFSFEVIDTADSMEELNKKEIQYIKDLNCLDQQYGYNLQPGGCNRTHHQITKDKISRNNKGRIPWNKGLSKENSDKMLKLSQDRKGSGNPMFGKTPHNKDQTMTWYDKNTMGFKKGHVSHRRKPTQQLNKQNELLNTYDSVSDAAKAIKKELQLDTSLSAVRKNITSNLIQSTKSAYGFVWRYNDNKSGAD